MKSGKATIFDKDPIFCIFVRCLLDREITCFCYGGRASEGRKKAVRISSPARILKHHFMIEKCNSPNGKGNFPVLLEN